MQPFPPTLVLRHRKENLKKCSLRGLELRKDFHFLVYPYDALPSLTGYVLLKLDAPPLSPRDCDRGLFILDATWRYAAIMGKQVEPHLSPDLFRSIPTGFRTAYPRRQEDCPNPQQGLASIEAIYIAYQILGRDVSGLMGSYHWKENFLELNAPLF